ncbi:hypothetical protein LOTGIDRAFT_156651 [Lottia gigantea]|uniref:RRM domain-containing protein n=1 Tax=Lottia gigantea TaxID=225164 RepID=V4B170_LOTGI|nr:hypothetical protein LOTGIDRAFT_156651 [Lottia gigantea]ESP04043.1 hypothetical protein LOTGIDRAFT_156651 [Lottia gigantea]
MFILIFMKLCDIIEGCGPLQRVEVSKQAKSDSETVGAGSKEQQKKTGSPDKPERGRPKQKRAGSSSSGSSSIVPDSSFISMTYSGSSESMDFSPNRDGDFSSDSWSSMEDGESTDYSSDFSSDKDFNDSDGNDPEQEVLTENTVIGADMVTFTGNQHQVDGVQFHALLDQLTGIMVFHSVKIPIVLDPEAVPDLRQVEVVALVPVVLVALGQEVQGRVAHHPVTVHAAEKGNGDKNLGFSPKRRKRSPTPKPSKVHIGHLTRNVNKDHIVEIFSTYGAIRNVEMMIDRLHPNFNRGFAYVEYEKSEDAEKAIKFMDGGQIDGQEVSAAAILQQRPPPRYPMRRSPPHHRRGPPPRWHNSPPRFRRRSPPPRRRSPPPRRRTRSRSPARRRRYSRSSSSSSR